MATIDKVSPLAPKGGFPDLPAVGGVRFSTVEAGVRYKGRPDVMLAAIDAGATMAGVFTRSLTRAAPVLWCEDALARLHRDGPESADKGFAIVVNSGNANAFTGAHGRKGVEATAAAAAEALDLPASHVFLSSTGVIGEPLPAEKITARMGDLAAALSGDAIEPAARAIMTTDTYPKGSGETLSLGGTDVRITGIAKGSGMIAPDMATMLVYIFTDAAVAAPLLQEMLRDLTDRSFNCITVDSDTSTSDTLLLAATGASGMDPITRSDDPRAPHFKAALGRVMLDLAHQVVRDGEGATKFVEIDVTGAASDAEAHQVGMAIANSPLVKTAIAGEDPNWGRIVMAVGKSGAEADRDRLTIRFGDLLVAEKGWVAESYREEDGAAIMREDEITIRVDLGIADGHATVWTCDLTHAYISINADYRS
ncbi:bifunctional glutamate N-acetyltransferase/amino-acid acetyltransferase ArgJ [Oceanomicrobium pacificus]|uniref:Arginine biosynthesis bifunctional protein ArgJ n=1 Tax=Oceanomicrobium pacificus TaxID=2692916 RepID=A0A6B0TLJ7_9RHOB|nr:bifunctional glutamate N-acetyltransferase/amino-acid acetyltransferase ArgJ [Oceanomicrobium pacificus]MXU64766.1 bifunctional glutamate N-acetyltransferase/amino-acid acetyltransferase ArgJ [Oceanomicrobium pacificus]